MADENTHACTVARENAFAEWMLGLFGAGFAKIIRICSGWRSTLPTDTNSNIFDQAFLFKRSKSEKPGRSNDYNSDLFWQIAIDFYSERPRPARKPCELFIQLATLIAPRVQLEGFPMQLGARGLAEAHGCRAYWRRWPTLAHHETRRRHHARDYYRRPNARGH